MKWIVQKSKGWQFLLSTCKSVLGPNTVEPNCSQLSGQLLAWLFAATDVWLWALFKCSHFPLKIIPLDTTLWQSIQLSCAIPHLNAHKCQPVIALNENSGRWPKSQGFNVKEQLKLVPKGMSVYVVDMDIFHCAENFVMLVVLWKVKQSPNRSILEGRRKSVQSLSLWDVLPKRLLPGC